MILLSTTTKALDQILEKGQAAPEMGVWVSEDRYRAYSSCIEQKTQIFDPDLKISPDNTNQTGTILLSLGIGLVLGFLASSMVR